MTKRNTGTTCSVVGVFLQPCLELIAAVFCFAMYTWGANNMVSYLNVPCCAMLIHAIA